MANNYIGIDGYKRSKEEDERISRLFASLFVGTENGKEVLKHLRSVTIEMIHGKGMTVEELNFMEGQRYLVAMIERRINHAGKLK